MNSPIHHYFSEDSLKAFIELLSPYHIRYWIDGGWGTDILTGCQIRKHRSLDVNVDAMHYHELLSILHREGFKTVNDTFPVSQELYCPRYGFVNIRPFIFNADGSSKHSDGHGGWKEIPASRIKDAVFAGQKVKCTQ